MTPAEMDADVDALGDLLGASFVPFRVDRCRHETVDSSVLWVLDRMGRQVAVISRVLSSSRFKWEVQKIVSGQPITRIACEELSEAAAYVIRYC